MSAIRFAEFVSLKIPFYKDILEIGCGNGITLKWLKEFYNVCGNDITIKPAIKNGIDYGCLYEYPIWKFPKTEKFDYTISTDVLEHIPIEKIDESIKRIIEISKKGTIHAICTRAAETKYEGKQVHLTVKPIWWWRKKFKEHNNSGIEVIIINTTEL
jgi:cyclopropane fatty-acyl-phospholipid synthase-like methyltransferase